MATIDGIPDAALPPHFKRLVDAAKALISTLNLRGPEKPHEKIGEHDALRYAVKNLRELRHQVAAGGKVDLEAPIAAFEGKSRVEAMAIHLGVTNLGAIRDFLAAELAAFTGHQAAAVKDLGHHAIFHEDEGWMDSRKLPLVETDDDPIAKPPESRRLKKAIFEGK